MSHPPRLATCLLSLLLAACATVDVSGHPDFLIRSQETYAWSPASLARLGLALDDPGETLTVEALRRRGLGLRALFLVGEPHAANERTLAKRLGALPQFSVPHFASLEVASLDAWLDDHDLRSLWR